MFKIFIKCNGIQYECLFKNSVKEARFEFDNENLVYKVNQVQKRKNYIFKYSIRFWIKQHILKISLPN